MSKVLRSSLHRNAVIVLFDAGLIRHDPALRETRARFGAGVLRSFPSSRCSFTAQDAQEAVAMFAETVKPAPRPSITPAALAVEISASIRRCQALGRRQDALLEAIRNPLPPLCGGSPNDARSAWTRRVDEIMNGIDDPDGNPTTDFDVANVAAMG
jgi:hypothetical protein